MNGLAGRIDAMVCQNFGIRILPVCSSITSATERHSQSSTFWEVGLPHLGGQLDVFLLLACSMNVSTADVDVHHRDVFIDSSLSRTKPRLKISCAVATSAGGGVAEKFATPLYLGFRDIVRYALKTRISFKKSTSNRFALRSSCASSSPPLT